MEKKASAYKKEYKVRTVGVGGKSYEVTMPPEFVEREAREQGMTPEEFIDKFRAVAYYNSFEGVYYKFEPKEQKQEILLPLVE